MRQLTNTNCCNDLTRNRISSQPTTSISDEYYLSIYHFCQFLYVLGAQAPLPFLLPLPCLLPCPLLVLLPQSLHTLDQNLLRHHIALLNLELSQ